MPKDPTALRHSNSCHQSSEHAPTENQIRRTIVKACARSRSTMSLKGYDEASLRPPAAHDDAAASDWDSDWDWGEVLLDRAAYMADKENHTSADCQFIRDLDGRQIDLRVTLCLAQPPRVSYFCCLAYCPADHGKEEEEYTPRLFVGEPWMIATDGKLALFTLCHGDDPCSRTSINNHDYFVYDAASSPSGKPRLTRLPQLNDDMLPTMGTFCFCASDIGIVRYRSDIPEDDAYRIATLAYDYFNPDHSGYYLCTYDSKACFRDIVSVRESAIIRFVDLQVHAEPGRCSQTPSGWTVVTWTLEGLDGGLDDLRFKEEYQLSSHETSNYRLPQSLFVCKPILSSHEDGVLYLLTNASSQDCRTSQVIAVDIKKNELLRVADFDMQRPNVYMRTTISSHLKPPYHCLPGNDNKTVAGLNSP